MSGAPYGLLSAVVGVSIAGVLLTGCGSSGTEGTDRPAGGGSIVVGLNGDDDADCTRSDPCLTFERAYRLAEPGETVEVTAGTYDAQVIGGDSPSRGQKRVVLQPAAGATVKLAALEVNAKHLELRGFIVGAVTTGADAEDVVLRDLTIRGGFFILSSQRVSVIDGSVGPGVDVHPMITSADGNTTPPRDILVDGVLFHDWTRSNDSVHTECLQIGGGDGIVVRNNRFRNCDVMDLHVTHYGDAPMTRNVTIENNFFSVAGDGGFYTVQANAYANLLFRNNSFAQPLKIFTGEGHGPNVNVRVVANVGPYEAWACEPKVIYRHNVWNGATCDATDLNAPSGFVDPAAGNFHLKPGAAAIDRGDPRSRPTADIDGDRRPLGKAGDAGADERA
jgi:hypothetical protein